MYEITVKPLAGSWGWIVEHEHGIAMQFTSRDTAEVCANVLVKRFSVAGTPARAKLFKLDGSIVELAPPVRKS